MGYLLSSNTAYLEAYLTQQGRELLINGDRDEFEIKFFSLGDSDVNYFTASEINTTTAQSNILESGFVPDISGENLDDCIKSLASGIRIKSFIGGGADVSRLTQQANVIPLRVTFTPNSNLVTEGLQTVTYKQTIVSDNENTFSSALLAGIIDSGFQNGIFRVPITIRATDNTSNIPENVTVNIQTITNDEGFVTVPNGGTVNLTPSQVNNTETIVNVDFRVPFTNNAEYQAYLASVYGTGQQTVNVPILRIDEGGLNTTGVDLSGLNNGNNGGGQEAGGLIVDDGGDFTDPGLIQADQTFQALNNEQRVLIFEAEMTIASSSVPFNFPIIQEVPNRNLPNAGENKIMRIILEIGLTNSISINTNPTPITGSDPRTIQVI